MTLLCLENSKINFRQKIQSVTNSKGLISREGINKIIPYGEEFIFLDAVDNITLNGITGYFLVSEKVSCVKSHYLQRPMMPASLIAEGFGQAGIILILKNLAMSEPVDIFAGNIETAKYFQIVRPGQEIKHVVFLKNFNSRIGVARIQGNTYVGKKLIANFSFVLRIVPQEASEA